MGSTHARGWRSIPGATLAAVADCDEQRLSGDFRGIEGNIGGPGEKVDFSAVRKYRTAEEAIADPEVDAVDICLPTQRHAPATLAALQAGKHVLVEKPMALDGESADRMVGEAQRRGRVLMVAQVVRFVPAYRSLIEMLKCGRLGAVRSAVFRRRCAAPAWGQWSSEAEQSGGGVFDLLIHDVDLCLHLFGVPEAVSAVGYEDMAGGIDSILARFHYPGIWFVTITGGWHHRGGYPFSMEFTVVADGGTMEYSSAGRPATLYTAEGKTEPLAAADDGEWYRAEIEYFHDCCTTGKKPVLCAPEESAAAVKLTRLMLESRARQGERIACRL
jgi:predicted dehydrogenase